MRFRHLLTLTLISLMFLIPACARSEVYPLATAEESTVTDEGIETAEKEEPSELPIPERREVTVQETVNEGFANRETIFYNGILLTMEVGAPQAKAIVIRGDEIVAVGSDEEILALQGPETQVIDLDGRTLVPGFIDSHSHRISNREKWGFDTPDQAVQTAVKEGWTTLELLAVRPEDLGVILDLIERGELPIRLNAYLALNSFHGEPFGDWYHNFEPGEWIGSHLRIAGIKIFIDFDSGRVLFWGQDELNELVRALQSDGWPVSVKAISVQSHELALNAFEYALSGEPNDRHRHRIEHSVAVTDEQLARMARLGIMACIQPGLPGVMSYDPDIHRMAEEHGQEKVFRWREYRDGGVIMAASPLNPPGAYDEQTDSTHMSPMGVLYRAVTQIGPDGKPPDAWMLEKTLNVEDLLPLLTINGAYTTSEEELKGSLSPGKWADLVILSDNPLEVETDELLDIEVLMTMVGGRVEWCAPGINALCPSTSASATTEQEPFVGEWYAVDPTDGSDMTLQITEHDGTYDVHLLDEGASACGLDDTGNPTIAVELQATGTVQAKVLSTSVSSLTCLTEPPTALDVSLTMDFAYQADTDTVVDSVQEAVWHRR